MAVSEIRSALYAEYEANSPLPTSVSNVKYEPAGDTPWARLSFIPNQPSVASLGAGGKDEIDGFVQIDLNFPMGSGSLAAETKADFYRTLFPAGARFSYNGQEVLVTSCGISSGRIIDSWYRVSVTIAWYAQLQR